MTSLLFFSRYFILLSFVLLSSIFFCLCFIFRPFNPANTRWVGKVWGAVAFKVMGVKVEKRGFEKTHAQVEEGPCIFVGNHQHVIDIFLYSSVVPKRTVSLGKKELLWVPFLGPAFWLAGNFFINRSNQQKAILSLQNIQQKMKEKKISIFIFPEGTRSFKAGLKAFKKGAFRMAIDNGFPIIPVVCSPFYTNVNFDKIKAGRVIMQALPAIPTANKTLNDLENLMKETWQIMKQEISFLDNELKMEAHINVPS